VSFQFDLHSAAVFDSHLPYRAHVAPVPYHDNAVLKASSQGHGTVRHGHIMTRRGMCELASAVQRPHVATCPRSGSSAYHAEFHEGSYQKHTISLNCMANGSNISGYHAEFQERHFTVGEWQGRGMVCVN
jgi:hypothetical protein